MSIKVPPLHLLKVFEAAGRTLSFKSASHELHVTPSAVSHQIKALEEHLGFPLFRRGNRSLNLTPAGSALLKVVSTHLQALNHGTQQVIRRYGTPSIRAHILPFMATEIVIPNLHAFTLAHPEIELRIETSYANADDFQLSGCDLGVRLGKGHWPGLQAEKLVDTKITPVCSPQFQRQENIRSLADIQGKTLINLPLSSDPWTVLAEEMKLGPLQPHQEITLDSYLSNLTAAEQGLGLALGLLPLIFPLLQKQRLVAPFDVQFRIDETYWIVFRPEDSKRKELQLFKRWLLDLFAGLQAQSDEFYSGEAHKVSFVANPHSQ